MKEKKHVIFIRHKFEDVPEILAKLWKERKIAIHYDDECLDLEKYSEENRGKVKTALNRFNECKADGGIVVAVYRRLHRNKLLLGEIAKGTPIECEKFPQNNRIFVLKTMQMTNEKELNYIDYPILGAAQPRQGTIRRIIKYKEVITHLFNNEELPDIVKSLSPEQLEVICYEYLKQKGLIDSLLLPIGRNLIDVDIIGMDKIGNKISAQVTFADEDAKVKDKFTRLLESIPKDDTKTKLFFFSPENEALITFAKEAKKNGYKNIKVENIERVYEELKESEKGKRLIDNMLNIST